MSETLTQFLAKYLISQSTKPSDDNCTYWGPCDLCLYTLDKWDKWINSTIHRGIVDWRYEWNTLMDKLDSDEFNGFWTMMSGEDNQLYIRSYNFFSQYKCSNADNQNSGYPTKTYPAYNGINNPDGASDSAQSKVFQTSSSITNSGSFLNGYRNTLFTDILELGRDMMCLNRSWYTMSTGTTLGKSPVDSLKDRFKTFTSSDAYKKLIAQTGVWNDKMGEVKKLDEVVDRMYIDLRDGNYIDIVESVDKMLPLQNPIPSPYALVKSLLEALMAYDWSDARNNRNIVDKYVRKCSNVGFCSTASQPKWRPGATQKCMKNGMITGIVKSIFNSLE